MSEELKRIKLDEEKVKTAINMSESAVEATIELFLMIGIDLEDDTLVSVDPRSIKIHPKTNEAIFDLFRKNHQRFYGIKAHEVMKGGLWFNQGWSTLYDNSLEIEEWEAVVLPEAVKK